MQSVHEKRSSDFISFPSGFPTSQSSLFSSIQKITPSLTLLICTHHHHILLPVYLQWLLITLHKMDILSLSPFLPLHLSKPCLYPENRALKGLLDRPSMDWAVYLSATTVNFSLVCHLPTTEKAHWVEGLLARADYLEFCQPVAKLSVA